MTSENEARRCSSSVPARGLPASGSAVVTALVSALLAITPLSLDIALPALPSIYGVAFATVNLGQLSGALLASRLVPRFGIDPTIASGLGCYLAGGLSLATVIAAGARHPVAVVVPMALFQFGNGMVMPNTLAGAIAPFPRIAGAASALAGFLQMVAGALSGLALGRLHDGSARPMAMLVAGSAVTAALAFGVLRRSGRRRQGSHSTASNAERM